MNLETEEKKKNKSLNRKFLLRGLVICVFLALLPFAGMKAWKQSLFFFYKGLWEQNYQGEYVVYYRITSSSRGILRWYSPVRDDELWRMADDCLENFSCEIIYGESYLPQFINFNDASQYSYDVRNFFNCSDLPAQDELLESLEEIEHDCRTIGFEPITNNE